MNKFFTGTSIDFIATALPKEKLILEELSSVHKEWDSASIKKIIKNTGISEVHVSPSEKTTSDYCVEAAAKIFTESGIKPDNINGIVFVIQTRDYLTPHTSAIIQARLGLPKNIIAFDIHYSCAGYVYGIFQASLLIETGCCENVLLCAGETNTKYVNPKDKSLRMVFGDAGSATVLSKPKKSQKTFFDFYTEGESASALIIPAGASRMPHQENVTDILSFDKNGNGRTLENLSMDGMQVMSFSLKHVKDVVYNTLEALNLSVDSIDLFAFHQASSLILNYLAIRLDLPHQKVPFGASKNGNTGSASIPLMLSTLYPGVNPYLEKVLVCGFGTGLTCAATVADLSRTRIFESIEI